MLNFRLVELWLQWGALFDFVPHQLKRLFLYIAKVAEETSFALLLRAFIRGGVLPLPFVLAFVEEDLGVYEGEWLHPESDRAVHLFVRRDDHRRHPFEVLVERRSWQVHLFFCQRLLPGQGREPIRVLLAALARPVDGARRISKRGQPLSELR